jgi:alkanesulfonate monooxygenase SsuD/methylene tetrahydromethanopterin reductase-like flavin-dependent oxidoreductase (luciferase family)
MVSEMSSKSVKFGTFLPQIPSSADQLANIAKINEEAANANEEAGFNSVWAGDHLVHTHVNIFPDVWTIFTAAALATKRILLGTCVTDIHRHHPAVLAQKLATLDQVSGGRFILGLGAGVAMNLEPFGIEWKKPVSKIAEAVKIMRRLWAGDRFSYEGEFWKFRDAFLQVKPTRSRIPIYFAANSPRMLRLTGEIADGWLPLFLSPELYKKRLNLIDEAARNSSRTLGDIDTGLYVSTSIADKAEDAYKQIDSLKSWIPPELLKEAGYKVKFPKEFSSMSYLNWLPTSEWKEKITRYGKLVPREPVIEFNITGTTQDCINKIEEFVKAGVRHFLLENAGPNPSKVREIYSKEIIPRFSG